MGISVKTGMILAVAAAAAACNAYAEAPPVYHNGEYLVCSDCHVSHPAEEPGGGSFEDLRGESALEEYETLPLKRVNVNETCLDCHDGQTSAPDVLGRHPNGYHRQAGALNMANSVVDGIYQVGMGHTLGTHAPPPGYEGSWSTRSAEGLSCIDCHEPHGRDTPDGEPSYRNLPAKSIADDDSFAPTVSLGTGWDDSVDVQILLDSYTPAQGNVVNSRYYSYGNILYHRSRESGTTPDDLQGSNRMVGGVCDACHQLFHGELGGREIGGRRGFGSSGASAFTRHPASYVVMRRGGGASSNLALFRRNEYKVPVLASSEDLGDAGPFCLSCHKAHGNANPFGLFFLDYKTKPGENVPSGFGPEEGSGYRSFMRGYQNLCSQCHPIGRGAFRAAKATPVRDFLRKIMEYLFGH